VDERPKVLVVDDTPANCEVLEAILAPRGYAVLLARSGEEALAKVASDRPDLVLLDIVMPRMDGYQVCKRLRDSPTSSYLPVVMITASDQEERVRALEAGADDFIQKPLTRQSCWPGSNRCCGSRRITTLCKLRLPSLPPGIAPWKTAFTSRSPSWSGCAGSDAF